MAQTTGYKIATFLGLLVVVMIFLMGSAFDDSFVGSVAVYDANGELYMIHAGTIENLSIGDGSIRFTFEGNDYMYINYFIEVIR